MRAAARRLGSATHATATAHVTVTPAEAGRLLAEARVAHARVDAARAAALDEALKTEADGYAALAAYEARVTESPRWGVAGYKVGATSPVTQARLGLKAPFWGPLFAPAAVRVRSHAAPSSSPSSSSSSSGTGPAAAGSTATATQRLSVSHDMIRGVEAEFAFVLGEDVAPRAADKPYDAHELLTTKVKSVMPAVEVCGSRMPAQAKASAAALIADGAGNDRVLLGWDSLADARGIPAASLRDQTAEVHIDGAVVAKGSGKEVLGSPVDSLAWFVNHVVQGSPRLTLRAGQFIITGAMCGLVPITKSSYVRVVFPDWRGGWKADVSFRD